MASKKKSIFEWRFFSFILAGASTILSILVLSLSSLAIIEAYNDNFVVVPNYMLWIFVLMGLMGLVNFFKERTRISFIRFLVILAFDIAIGVVVLFAKNNPFLFSVTAGLYCATIVISRVFSIIQKPTVRSIVINALIVALAVALAIGILSTDPNQADVLKNIILVECLFIAIVSFVEAMSIALAQLKVRVLFKIITNTFSLEVLFGLLVIIVCFSIILAKVEPAASTEATIQNFPDALWYCFAVVTTIGFGDKVAITPIGRILTVILGIYGLVVDAVITSIIVNFYNATVGKQDQKELEEIKDEEKKAK